MSDFTDEDRTKLIETHTMLSVIVEKVDDHEKRLRTGERVRNQAVGWAIGSGAGIAALIEGVKAKFGG